MFKQYLRLLIFIIFLYQTSYTYCILALSMPFIVSFLLLLLSDTGLLYSSYTCGFSWLSPFLYHIRLPSLFITLFTLWEQFWLLPFYIELNDIITLSAVSYTHLKYTKKLTHTPQSHTIKPIWSTRSQQEATIIIVNQHICT